MQKLAYNVHQKCNLAVFRHGLLQKMMTDFQGVKKSQKVHMIDL